MEMTAEAAAASASTADREIVLTRVLDAPRELVFDAFTDPEHIDEWWGPNGFTNTTRERDVRVGGVWRFTMHGPDGTDYPNRAVYREIVRPERIVYDHDADDDAGEDRFHVTITFDDAGEGKTRLTMRMLFATAGERDRTVGFGAIELGHQTLDRLAAHLAAR
jgi:uncharacterized protein YndB with AHSA1/START domain